MSIQGIEQGRAAYAFDEVKGYIAKHSAKHSAKQRNEYRSYIKKMPSMIQVNGLGQTLAFFFSKGGVYLEIYDQVAKWIKQKYPDFFKNSGEEAKAFVEMVVKRESKDYRLLTMEVLALLNWMRRFAEGMVKSEKESSSDGE